MKESDVLNKVRLAEASQGVRLFRNNVGCYYARDGSFIRYGLCNESAEVNRVMKSADLIGIRPVIIEPWMCGATFGMFVSRECKATDFRPDNSKRYLAQVAWRDLINSLGGDAKIVNGVE